MTRVSWAWTGIALVTGIAFGVFIGLRIGPGGNPNLVDLSALPDQLREQHRNAAFLESEARNYTKGQEQLAKKRAELAKRRLKKLPDGLSSVPLGQLYEPDADVHWPRNVSGDVGVALDEAKDGWVILNYWASWCAPCIAEMPSLQMAAEQLHADRIDVLLISVDRGSVNRALPVLRANGVMTPRLGFDPKAALSREMGVTGLPTSFLLSADQQTCLIYVGPREWHEDQMQSEIRGFVRATSNYT